MTNVEREVLLERLKQLRAKRDESERSGGFMPHSEASAAAVDVEIHDVRRQIAALDQSLRLSEQQAAAEEGAFWFRRFFTTLAIANGAAFVALAAGFMQADDRAVVAGLLPRLLRPFAIGMFAAGAMPIVFWAQIQLHRYSDKGFVPKAWGPPLAGLLTVVTSACIGLSVLALIVGVTRAIDTIGAYKEPRPAVPITVPAKASNAKT